MKNKKNTMRVALGVAVASVAMVAVAKLIVDFNENVRSKDREVAINAGINRAKQECLKEGKPDPICNSISVEAAEGEYEGAPGWIVYARSSQGKFSGSLVVVIKNSGEVLVGEYVRNIDQ